MKRTARTVTAHDVEPAKIVGVMAITSGLTFATLVTVCQLFFTHSVIA